MPCSEAFGTSCYLMLPHMKLSLAFKKKEEEEEEAFPIYDQFKRLCLWIQIN